MPASGKSTVGVVLAKVLGMDFIDTDLLLQKAYGKKLPAIIEDLGHDGFLRAEGKVCRELDAEGTVIATGGSAVYSSDAMEHLRASGCVVYLQADIGELKERLRDFRNRGVVLRDGQTIDSLMEERRQLYERYADITVSETGLSLEETVNTIAEKISERNTRAGGNVIHLFGPSGAGTSTLGRFIAARLDAFFMDTDDYFWQPTDPPFTAKRAAPERLALIRKDICAHGNVVLSGSLTGWGDELIPLFTLAVRVEADTEVRLARIRARERARFGSRIDPGGDMFETHQAFLDWAASYDSGGTEMRSRANHDEWQKLLRCPLVCVDGSLPPETNWEVIRRSIL